MLANSPKTRWNIFDLTKVWPQKEVPLRRFGKFTLNKNPDNYFSEIEQAAFSPSHMVPGVEPSADPVLQSRLFSYPDTHRHRLGVNYQQIPVNRPLHAFNPYQRDGLMAVNGNYGSNPVGFSASMSGTGTDPQYRIIRVATVQ
jgi:catalase